MAKLFTKNTSVTPPLVEILCVLSRLDAPVDLVITAGTNGQHMKNSLHYKSAAVDVRSKNFPSKASSDAFLAKMKAAFGPKYDILYEDAGTPNEHFHIEFDPKV